MDQKVYGGKGFLFFKASEKGVGQTLRLDETEKQETCQYQDP